MQWQVLDRIISGTVRVLWETQRRSSLIIARRPIDSDITNSTPQFGIRVNVRIMGTGMDTLRLQLGLGLADIASQLRGGRVRRGVGLGLGLRLELGIKILCVGG